MRGWILGLTLVVAAPVAAVAASDVPGAAIGTIRAPLAEARGPQALLVVLPGAGPGDHAVAARAAQEAAASHLRLWTAVASAGANAEVSYQLLAGQVREAGFRSLGDRDVVVAGYDTATPGALQIAAAHDVAGLALLGANPPAGELDAVRPPVLRVAAELDRSVRVSRLALEAAGAPVHRPVAILSGADAPDLAGAAAGETLGQLAAATLARLDLTAVGAGHRALVHAFAAAVTAEQGATCATLQQHTADLAPTDAARISVSNRASAHLFAPDPADPQGWPSDLGGFVYDKAELADDGETARLVTNSYTVPGAESGTDATPVGAAEVMCKTKSRSAVAQAVYGDHTRVDASPPTCAGHNAAVVAWARDSVSPAAASRFAGATVQPDDPKRAGPEWVFSPLVLRPAPEAGAGAWTVQAPSLVTELTDTDLDPRFAGNHYCKVLSPVRALDLVLVDAVRIP